MRIMKREMLLIALFLSTMALSTKSFSAPAEDCGAMAGCAPCGYEAGNTDTIPNLSPSGVNPILNYVATAEDIRCRGYFGGLYVGAAYGIGAISYDLKIGNAAPTMIDSDTRSYLVTIFNAGFNFVIENFFLGGEIGYDYRSRTNPIGYYDLVDFLATTANIAGLPVSQAQSFPCKVHLDINSQHVGTADILPGFVFNRFVGYLRLGVEKTKYTWSRRYCLPFITVDTVDLPNVTTVTDGDFVESQKKSENGYRLGVGFGYALGLHVSLHLNYIHIFGNTLDFTPKVLPTVDDFPIVNVGAPVVISSPAVLQLAAVNSIQPQRNEVTLGVKFRF